MLKKNTNVKEEYEPKLFVHKPDPCSVLSRQKKITLGLGNMSDTISPRSIEIDKEKSYLTDI